MDTSACPDPAAATATITDTLTVVVAAPKSGGVAAAVWKPTIDGFREAVTHANFDRAFGSLNIDVVVVDLAGAPQRAPIAVQPAIDDGAQVVAAVAGDDANLALRFTLNEQCIPQIFGFAASPELGDVDDYPWTLAVEPSTDRAVQVVGTLLADAFPDGGTVGIYTANDDRGTAYRASVAEYAASARFDVVSDEVVAPSPSATPESVDRLTAARPDVVMAAPAGLDCAYFLRELSLRRNLAPDWQPVVIVDSACASDAVLGLAGPGADGVYTTADLIDAAAPESVSIPEVGVYSKWMTTRGLAAEIGTAEAGWTAGEALVATVQQALQSPNGLSRESLIEAARALDVAPSLTRPGIRLRTDGARDPFAAESAQVVQWNADRRTFVDVGAVVTQFET